MHQQGGMVDCKVIPFPKKSANLNRSLDDSAKASSHDDPLMDDLWDDWIRQHGDEPFDLDYDGDPQPMTEQEQVLFLKDLRKWKHFQSLETDTSYSDLLDSYDDNQMSLEQEATFEYLRHMYQRVMEFDLFNALTVLKGDDLQVLLKDVQQRPFRSAPLSPQ
ncbi:MAG: hypothetical protein AB8C84_07525 [Oligoflexales bacterium]